MSENTADSAMHRFKNVAFYIFVIGGFSALMYWIVVQGSRLEAGRNVVLPSTGRSQWAEFLDSITYNLQYPLALLLLQIITIIIVARFFAWICTKIGQPTVIGEMIAGIVLGPSLVGMYFPALSQALFPEYSLGNLQFLSQIGLILFMYIIGMELDLKVLRNKAHDAVVVSHSSIIIPFALGMGLAYFLYTSFAPMGVKFSSFGLFLGIAMSITAFPVLARIVQERGIHKTRLGTIVITCAAADDITAWCLLAAVIAIVKAGSFVSSLYVIALAVAYVIVMIKVVRPFLNRIGDLHASRERLSKPVVAIFFLTLILSAYATEVIGIHALFGAFMAGAIMPENERFRSVFIEKVEDVALVLLLPLFFVFTGLRTQIGLLNDPYLWGVTALIIIVAVIGKFVGSALAAKYVGQSWRDSLAIGALMNTRGLMELVVLNIGYDLGVLSDEIFAMMVIMALVTTFMTGPALDLIDRVFKPESDEPEDLPESSGYSILMSFGNPERGRSLLRLANSFLRNVNGSARVTAMHLSPSEELNQYNIPDYEKNAFAPVIDESSKINQRLTTLFKPSNDIVSDIAEVANKGDYDLLLVGLGQSIFEGSVLGKVLGFTTRIVRPNRLLGRDDILDSSLFDNTTREILSKSRLPVGILIDKGLIEVNYVFLPLLAEGDEFLLDYVELLTGRSNTRVTVAEHTAHLEQLEAKTSMYGTELIQVEKAAIRKELLTRQDLMLVSANGWKELVDTKPEWLNDIPTTLILMDR